VAQGAARASAPSTGSVRVGNNSRKRRRSESPNDTQEPIVFQSPGLKPDVRLTICGQEFHVHSVILKLHSNFFRKFLDSPDKEAAPASSPFKYDHVSVIDADGISGLEPVATAKVRCSYYCGKMCLLFERSLPDNFEHYFHETSNAEVYTNPLFRFEVETHTRSNIITPVFTNNPKCPFTFR
jgi:hypothetical protein